MAGMMVEFVLCFVLLRVVLFRKFRNDSFFKSDFHRTKRNGLFSQIT